MEFAVTLTRNEEGRVQAACPDVPAATAVGEYEGDALANAQRALTAVFTSCIRERRPIPRPSRRGKTCVTVPVLTQMKLALYEAMREGQVARADLARRLRWHRPQVDRLLDLHHASKLDQLEAALGVLGRRVKVTVEAARAASKRVKR